MIPAEFKNAVFRCGGESRRVGPCSLIVSQFRRPRGILGRAAGWIMAHHQSNLRRNLWTIELLGIAPHDRVLEIGFGPGIALQAAAEVACRGMTIGVEHSATMFDQATRRNAAAIPSGRIELHLSDEFDFLRSLEPVDRIYAVNVVQFRTRPVDRLCDLRHLPKPHGRIVLTFQPRWKGATNSQAREAGQMIAGALLAAGFSKVWTEFLPLKPVAAVAVIGTPRAV